MPASLLGSVARVALITGVFTMIAACAVPTVGEDVEGTTSSAVKCAASSAQKLSAAALSVNGKKSQHRCYAYVKKHLRSAGMPTSQIDAAGYALSAYMFAVWAKKNPAALSKMGLVEAAGTSLDKLPRGAVIVWARGQCGYSSEHGHIEIVVDDNSTKACSDFCGSIKKTCGAPSIFVPKGCAASSSPVVPSADPDDAPQELDDVPLPVPRPTDLGDGSSTPDDSGPTDDGASCYSNTLGTYASELACVYSEADGETEQCHDGSWYRGVDDMTGPYGTCTSSQ